jgi:hypothetical protein
MSTMTFGQKTFTPTPPEKGSFPLDRQNICRRFMMKYMICLKDHEHKNEQCRIHALRYFKCRMDNDLMDKTEFDKLGYSADEIAKHGNLEQ